MWEVVACLTAALAGAVSGSAAQAQSAIGPAPAILQPQPMAPARETAKPLSGEDLSAWLDGLIPYAIDRGDIAGAEVVVVKDGRLLFERGYGVADVKTRRPVDPKRTLFRPGSISKLFTWTAAMQLVEQGKLDLDRDVNDYLDFRIPPAFGKPITLRNLMTHTPGFEETIKGLFAKDRRPLDGVLKTWVPTRIFAPGKVSAYSNYGAALTGYIVQRVSGESFEQYIRRHIFDPLRMQHASFEQPLPKGLAADMSKGYETASGREIPFETINMSPAGALSIAGDDISHFMIAHLNNGAYAGMRILKPQTAELMHGNAYRPVQQLPAMGLGFYHEDRNGHDVVAHGGDTVAFHSDLHLILDEGVGLYYSQNSAGKQGSGLRATLYERFMDRYFPAKSQIPAESTLKTAKQDGESVAGSYELSRRSESNFMFAGDIFSEFDVSANGDGTISVGALKNLAGIPIKWREVGPNVWREVNGTHTLIATYRNGKVVRIDTDKIPPILVASPAPLSRSYRWNLPLLIGTAATLGMVVLFWPIKAILRWRYDRPFSLTGRVASLYRWSRVIALIDIFFFGGWAVYLSYASSHLEWLDNRADPYLRALQVFGLFGVIGAVIPVWQFVAGLHGRIYPWWTMVTNGLFALAALAFVWFAFSLKLLTFSLNY